MIEDAVAQLRAKLSGASALSSPRESLETRLTLACLRGTGHLLITGPDRGEIDRLLARVIEKVEPLATVKARASDPATGMEQVLALGAGKSMPKGYLERQRVLTELVQRAEAADKAVLVVVDDAEAATVDQLEHLRESLEVVPDAVKYLRLVLIGNSGLLAKLHTETGRPLSARIASHVRLDEPGGRDDANADPASTRVEVKDTSRSYALTLAAATCVAFSTVVCVTALFSGGGRAHDRQEPVAANVNSRDFEIAVGAMGGDPPATDPTIVSAAAPFTPAFSIPAPTIAPTVAPDPKTDTKAAAKAVATKTTAPATTGKTKTGVAKKPTSASSISSFMKRFR